MAEKLEYEELDENLEEPGEGEGEKPEEELIFGKYKTLEEAERAHKDLERQFHASRQPPKAETPDYGYVQAQQPSGPGAQEEGSDATEALLEDPGKFIDARIGATIVQLRQFDRVANANRRAALRELRSNPAYNAVSEELETALDGIEPAYLVDPQQARQIVRAMFGERLIERTGAIATPAPVAPSTHARRRDDEIEAPDDGPSEEPEPLDRDGEALLRSLGLAPKSRKSVSESYARRMREAR